MLPERFAQLISQEDKGSIERLMGSIELRSSQEAVFDIWEVYIGEKLNRTCGKCRVRTVQKIKKTMQYF